MSDISQKDLDKKFQELFDNSEIPNRMDAINNSLMDMEPDEQAEVKEHLAKLMGRKESRKPKRNWKWSFYGKYIFKALLFLVEFAILTGVLYFFIPLSINTSVTILQALSGSILMTFVRQWWSK